MLLMLAACGLAAQPAAAAQAVSAQKTVLTQAASASARAQPVVQKKQAVKKKVQKKKRAKVRRGTRRGSGLELQSGAVFVVDQDSGETLAAKNADRVLPIASLTKLMTALVVINSVQPLDEVLEITKDDIDTVKRSYSRLPVGTKLTRDEMLLLALMSSENRASNALARHYPGGREAFIKKMNIEAESLGLRATRFADAAGLSSKSVSTARELHQLLNAAYAQPLIRDYSTRREASVTVKGRKLTFISSNRLLRKQGDWDIQLQKTGFTNEAGRCLVMQANVLSRRLAMIFLDSSGTLTRYADAARVKRKLQLDAKKPAARPTKVSAAALNAS